MILNPIACDPNASANMYIKFKLTQALYFPATEVKAPTPKLTISTFSREREKEQTVTLRTRIIMMIISSEQRCECSYIFSRSDSTRPHMSKCKSEHLSFHSIELF